VPVGGDCDGLGVCEGSSPVDLWVGSGDESGVGMTVGVARGGPSGEASRVASKLSCYAGWDSAQEAEGWLWRTVRRSR